MVKLFAILCVFLAIKLNVNSYRILSETIQTSDILARWLQNIYQERPFNSMLIVHQSTYNSFGLQMVFKFQVPRMILTNTQGFHYKIQYNSEILTILMMNNQIDTILLENVANALQCMRQGRIVILAGDVASQDEFRKDLAERCELYHFTNVLLLFFFQGHQELRLQFDMLKPFPNYHWELNENLKMGFQYFPEHWRNFNNITLVTFPDQLQGRTFVYKDSRGNMKLSGSVANLILLFGKHFNASLKIYEPLKTGNYVHYTIISQMVSDGKLDFAMSLDVLSPSISSDFVDIGSIFLYVPCALPLTIAETFAIICNVRFFAYILITTQVFSIALLTIDWVFNGWNCRWHQLLDNKVLRAVMGQAFNMAAPRWAGSNVLYIFMGFVGIISASLFSGNLSTLLTTPPYHQQVKTFADLLRSPVKILIPTLDYKRMAEVVEPFASSFVVSANASYVAEQRNNFNTAYGYHTTSTGWRTFDDLQKLYNHKIMCIWEGLTLYSLLSFGIRVQINSPYLEALNFHIHRIHEMGLFPFWRASAFMDMRKMGKYPMKMETPQQGSKALNCNDLYWIWIIVIIGLACSFVIFLLELWIRRRPLKIVCRKIKF